MDTTTSFLGFRLPHPFIAELRPLALIWIRSSGSRTAAAPPW